MTASNLSHGDTRSLLDSSLNAGKSGYKDRHYIRDVYPTHVVYEDGRDGGLKQRPYAIGDDNTVALGDPQVVVQRTSYEPVQTATFSLDGDTTDKGDYVLRSGKIFEAGDYADINFSITPDEMAAAVAAFSPVANDLEHRPSILDGNLGELRSVAMADDGKSLVGTVAIPSWLHKAVGDAPLKASLAWNRITKRIIKNGLVLTPRVPDVALMSAYAEFAGARHSASDQRDMQTIHDVVVGQGATCDPATMSKEQGMATEQEQAVGLWQTIKTFFTAQDPATAGAATFGATASGETPTEKTLRAEMEALRAERIAERATAFADGEVAAKRAVPAERATMIALFAQSARDDAVTGGTVTFSTAEGEKTGGRVDALRALYATRPAHILTDELVKLTEAQVTALTAQFGGGPATEAVNAEEKRALMGMTALGATVAAAKK